MKQTNHAMGLSISIKFQQSSYAALHSLEQFISRNFEAVLIFIGEILPDDSLNNEK